MGGSRFNPNESLFIKDQNQLQKYGSSVLTRSNFGTKNQMRNTLKSTSPRSFVPTYPNNEKANGLVIGQKTGIKTSPRNHNIMGELGLKHHFLRKLNELRDMKEEYYGVPVQPDPLEILAQREKNNVYNIPKKDQAVDQSSPWTADGS